MKSHCFNKIIKENTTGTVRQTLTIASLKNLKIPVYSKVKVKDLIASIDGKVITNKTLNTEELGKQVELGSIVKGRGLVMTGVTESGKETDRSSRTSKLKACLNLVENSIAKKGPRSVYIRVKGPDGILMTADQQHLFTFEGEQMIYSASREVDYQGAEVEVCIYFDPGQKLTKGVYTVEAYTEEARLAATDMLLR